jgi:stage II sporulation protein D
MNTLPLLAAAALLSCGALSAPLFSRGIEIPTDLSLKTRPTTIKVLIGKHQNKILLEAKGRYKVYDPFSSLPITEGVFSKRQWLKSSENGLVWGGLLPGVHQMRLVPQDAQSTVLVGGIEYKGCIEIYDMKGKLHIVNEVDIERYLKSVMTAQLFNDLDEEVLDAVAITARTNAYYLVYRKLTAHWHVNANDVGYQGYALTLQNPPIERAIHNTRHMVMTYQGMPFPATWTKNSAGRTAPFATIFRKAVQTPEGVETCFAAHDRQKHSWAFSITKQNLAKALGRAHLTELDLYQDSTSQKVYGARIKEDGQAHQLSFAELQEALGNARLKSNDFTVETAGNTMTFRGFGEGSGVGLCLYNANAMADLGHKAPKILASLFPETTLEKIPSLEEREKNLLLEETNLFTPQEKNSQPAGY